MPKRISKKTTDPNEIAFQVAQAATIEAATGAIKKGVIEGITEGAQLDSKILSEIKAQMGGKMGGKKSLETMIKGERKKRA